MIGVIFNKEAIKEAKKFLKAVEVKKNHNLIFLVLDENVFFRLEESKNKKEMIQSPQFLSKIKYSLCGYFDVKKNTITLQKCNDEWVSLLIETINKYFEDTVHIIIPLTDATIPEGFKHIHQCDWDNTVLCGVRQNKFLTKAEKTNALFELEYLKRQKGDFCTMTIQLDKDSIDYLQYITKAGVTVGKTGHRSQKEVFGKFNIVKSSLQKGEVVHTLKIDKSSVVYGTEDEISTTGSLYTFHSHPFNAYLMYKTKFGVPSAADYWAVYNMCKKTNAIVHFVASLEGVYVISCVPDSRLYQNGNPDEIKALIWKLLKIRDDNQVQNLQSYIQRVNDIGLFKLHLLPWKDIEHKNVTISFSKLGKTCLIHDN